MDGYEVELMGYYSFSGSMREVMARSGRHTGKLRLLKTLSEFRPYQQIALLVPVSCSWG